MRRFCILFIVLALIFGFAVSLPVSAEGDGVISSKYESYAESIYLYSYDTKSVLYSVATEKILKPASTAKIMSGLIACEKLASRLDENVLITKEMLVGHTGTTMGLSAGMTLSIKDLLYGAICGCNNDATQVLAFVCSGSIENFVSEMNDYAQKLNMSSTFYANPTGLDEPLAKTTASDVALLSFKAAKNDLYMQISSAKKHTVDLSGESRTVYNRNALISHFTSDQYLNDSVLGLNAGSTDEGGYVVSALADVDNSKYLCIVMGAESTNGEIYSYKIANELISKASSAYKKTLLFSKGKKMSELDVRFALNTKDEPKVSCILKEDVYAYLPNGVDAKNDLKYSVFLHGDVIDAPVNENTVLGGVNVYYKGELVASGVLVSNETISENSFLAFMNSMKEFLLSRYFLIFLVFLLLGILTFLYFDRKRQRRKKVGYIQYKKF